jgi:hypothetical protein
VRHGAPIFPNLAQEASVGYDVHINLPGLPLFFQYELPELMTRKSAREISKYQSTVRDHGPVLSDAIDAKRPFRAA